MLMQHAIKGTFYNLGHYNIYFVFIPETDPNSNHNSPFPLNIGKNRERVIKPSTWQ